MSRRELVAHVVADVEADPIPASRFGVPVEKVTRRGYVAGAVCRHCADGLVIVEVGRPWVHQSTRIQSCVDSRVRSGPGHPNGSHVLEVDPVTGRWFCPACMPPTPGFAHRPPYV